jgi:hypothetical protein
MVYIGLYRYSVVEPPIQPAKSIHDLCAFRTESFRYAVAEGCGLWVVMLWNGCAATCRRFLDKTCCPQNQGLVPLRRDLFVATRFCLSRCYAAEFLWFDWGSDAVVCTSISSIRSCHTHKCIARLCKSRGPCRSENPSASQS